MMPEYKPTNTAEPLNFLLERMMAHHAINDQQARAISHYRRISGTGMIQALKEFNINSIPLDCLTHSHVTDALEGYIPSILSTRPIANSTFDSLVNSSRNEFPIEVAYNVATSKDRSPYSPLYIYSGIGLGKTHLLCAIANKATADSCRLINVADLQMEHRLASAQGQHAALVKWLDNCHTLLIDDIQFLEDDKELQQILFSVINRFIETDRIVAISSDVPPTRLKTIEQRLVSRLSSGVLLSLVMPATPERIEILQQMAGIHTLNHEVVKYLAENIKDNIRHLKAAARQLISIQEFSTNDVDIDIARAVVPLPRDLRYTSSCPPPPICGGALTPDHEDEASQFRQMLAMAETEEEQVLALQIALNARLRKLKQNDEDIKTQQSLEHALLLLRQGKMEEAFSCIE